MPVHESRCVFSDVHKYVRDMRRHIDETCEGISMRHARSNCFSFDQFICGLHQVKPSKRDGKKGNIITIENMGECLENFNNVSNYVLFKVLCHV